MARRAIRPGGGVVNKFKLVNSLATYNPLFNVLYFRLHDLNQVLEYGSRNGLAIFPESNDLINLHSKKRLPATI